jgi:hypothetical protein
LKETSAVAAPASTCSRKGTYISDLVFIVESVDGARTWLHVMAGSAAQGMGGVAVWRPTSHMWTGGTSTSSGSDADGSWGYDTNDGTGELDVVDVPVSATSVFDVRADARLNVTTTEEWVRAQIGHTDLIAGVHMPISSTNAPTAPNTTAPTPPSSRSATSSQLSPRFRRLIRVLPRGAFLVQRTSTHITRVWMRCCVFTVSNIGLMADDYDDDGGGGGVGAGAYLALRVDLVDTSLTARRKVDDASDGSASDAAPSMHGLLGQSVQPPSQVGERGTPTHPPATGATAADSLDALQSVRHVQTYRVSDLWSTDDSSSLFRGTPSLQ